jgi:HlyD family secretion protein
MLPQIARRVTGRARRYAGAVDDGAESGTAARRRADLAARRRLAPLLGLAALAVACGGEAGDRLVGTLERDRVELIAEAREPVVEIAVREGDPVAPGDLVVRLSDERLRLEVERLRAVLAQRSAELEEAVEGPRAERLAEARARVAGARSDVETARLDLERQRALRASGVVAEQAVDHAENVHQSASARLDQARADLDELVAGTRSERLRQALQAEAAARVAVAEAEIGLARLEVRAPVAGVIDALPYELGERPAPGAVVAVLLAGGAPWARVFVPEPRRAAVAVGDPATVRPDGTARSFRARVRRVRSDPAFSPFFALTEHDRGRLAYEAEIELIDEAARELPTGLPVEVELGVPSPAAGDG